MIFAGVRTTRPIQTGLGCFLTAMRKSSDQSMNEGDHLGVGLN